MFCIQVRGLEATGTGQTCGCQFRGKVTLRGFGSILLAFRKNIQPFKPQMLYFYKANGCSGIFYSDLEHLSN